MRACSDCSDCAFKRSRALARVIHAWVMLTVLSQLKAVSCVCAKRKSSEIVKWYSWQAKANKAVYRDVSCARERAEGFLRLRWSVCALFQLRHLCGPRADKMPKG